ncbi:hypothetical protein V5O48_002060 [Marasmius crinis-equi]|uniref:CS domain-containing protein n=1 Tax=Marasmius crinis-equi TaxID=585013 RepID=A0ABR3FWT8_9AGAR
MITPRFSCAQTAESVIISIYCPSVRAADVEINVDDTLVSVHINPYFLRLNFSHPLLEDDASSAQYDPSTGYLTITLTKELRGQHFEDLDLLAKLLAPRPVAPPVPPSIEVINSEGDGTAEEELIARTQDLALDEQEFIEAAQNDWQLPQTIQESTPIKLTTQCHYGFLDAYTGYFTNVSYTENEVNELGADAERCTREERRSKRITHEDEKWDVEHYMADYAEDEYIQELLKWTHPHNAGPSETEFSEKENAMMLNLPKKEYIPTQEQTRNLYLTLVTILFSYAYDSRTTQCDPTPESAWTMCTLTPAFSAMDPAPYTTTPRERDSALKFNEEDIEATLAAPYRRSLSFPLYRSFALAEKCRKDVASFLSRGKRTVFRCLLEMKDILDHHEVYYIYSKLWLDDYCVWIQSLASDEILSQLGSVFGKTSVRKKSIGWDLEQIEAIVDDVQTGQDQRDTDSDDTDSDDE